jgi:hypothetical protein
MDKEERKKKFFFGFHIPISAKYFKRDNFSQSHGKQKNLEKSVNNSKKILYSFIFLLKQIYIIIILL